MEFKPRLTPPSSTNKYFISDEFGGLNPCIIIEDNSCLPNCVGYGFGRVYELLGYSPKLARYNAEDWYNYTKDGYPRSKTPKLGSVMCWSKGELWTESDGAGHIGVVEVITDTKITVSMSEYGGKRWYTRDFYIGKYDYNGLKFQGFIHPPYNFNKKCYEIGDYVVTTDVLNVREEPTTKSKRLSFDELTNNAKEQVLELCGYKCNGYCEGVEFTALKIKENWGLTPSGWVCLDYCKKI